MWRHYIKASHVLKFFQFFDGEVFMSKYKELGQFVTENLRDLKKGNPDLMQGFGALSAAASKAGALDKKTKELLRYVAMTVSVPICVPVSA